MSVKQIKKGFIRLKGFHVLIWFALSALIQVIYYDPRTPILQQWLATLVVTALCALPAYYGAYRLVPRLLYKKRVGAFSAALILAMLVNSAATLIIAGSFYYAMTGRMIFSSALHVAYFWAIVFVTNIIVITISCAVKIIADSFRMEVRLNDAEAERQSSELAFLRSQINPHFLFNVLNTIYFQIHHDNTGARSSVEKLSELLRYQLYECTSDTVSLSKEIAYIQNYVEVQRLRMEPGTDVALDTQEGKAPYKIAPLLVLPLVENAFKHISHHKDPASNKLHIALRAGDGQLMVQIFNTCDPLNAAAPKHNAGGLGLQNVRRRLALLYPDAHSLNIRQGAATFEITLNIQLS